MTAAAESGLTYDPRDYVEWWVPEQDMKDATGTVVGVKRILKARVSFDWAVEQMARRRWDRARDAGVPWSETNWDDWPEGLAKDDWRSAEADLLRAALGGNG